MKFGLRFLAVLAAIAVPGCGGRAGSDPAETLVIDAQDALPDPEATADPGLDPIPLPDPGSVPDIPDVALPDPDGNDVPEPDPGPDPGTDDGPDTPVEIGLADEAVPDPGSPVEPEADSGTDVPVEPDPGPADPGTPPDPGPPPLPAVVLNEVASRNDFIEVAFAGPEPSVDLGDWFFATDPTDPVKRFTIPAGTTVAAGGRLTWYRKDKDTGAGDFDFGIANGAMVWLVAPDKQVADSVLLPVLPKAFTWGRLPDTTGDWAYNEPTPNAMNSAPVDLQAPIYDPSKVPTVDLTLSDDAKAALGSQPYEYVAGKFRFTDESGATGEMDVGIHLKGHWGSFRPLSGKAGFRVKFNFNTPKETRFRGLEHMVLNNMVQDATMIHEVVVWSVWRAYNVPSPRWGYAWVRVNGEDYGFYGNVEAYDKVMLNRWFPSTKHELKGRYGTDLNPGSESKFEIQEGDESDLSELTNLIQVAHDTPDEAWWTEVSKVADLEEMTRMWAIEHYFGHWDGYSPTINNYSLHSDDDGYFSMQGWDCDQTFSSELDYYSGKGYLFQRCMASAECHQAYNLALAYLLPVIDGLDLDGQVVQYSAFVEPWVIKDPRKGHSYDEWLSKVPAMRSFIAKRRADAGMMFQCLASPDPDADKDGYLCVDDCADDDPAVHPGAKETCGDKVDQDCSGIADDGPDCPCIPFWRGPHRYLLCPQPLGWDAARERCQKEGSDLAVIADADEQKWLMSALNSDLKPVISWIGLDDVQTDGAFVWVDGKPMDYSNWASGQPNGGTAQNCVMFQVDGTWNDHPCDELHPPLCEDVCAVGLDKDKDGYGPCNGDCDESDSTVHAGAPDLCGDGIDQDCDGVADGSPVCALGCSAMGPASLKLTMCPDARTWNEAKDLCAMMGKDLAFFTSATDQQQIWKMLSESGAVPPTWDFVDAWIGLNDQANEGDFRWVDGTVPAWSGWCEGQPNDGNGTVLDLGGEQDCSRLVVGYVWNTDWNNTWWDSPCSELHPFLCRGK